MSLFQSTVTPLFYVFSLVSCVSSHTFATPTEVTAVTKVVKDNSFYDIMMSELLQRVNMDYIDGGQKNTRVKKSNDKASLAEAARMPSYKLVGLVLSAFRHLFSNKRVDGDKPIKTKVAAKDFAQVIKRGIEALKRKSKAYYGF